MQIPNSEINRRILITEDEPAISLVCQRTLGDEGFKLDIAGNGKEAQEMIENRQYILFLFDIKMPLMDGKQLYHWLNQSYPQLTNRVIFISGSIGGDTQRFLEEVDRPFLPKPFTPNELTATVMEVLENN